MCLLLTDLMFSFYILLQYSSEIVCRWIIVCLPMTEVTRTHSIQTTSRIEGQKGEKVYEDKTHYESYIHSYEVIFQMVFNHVVISVLNNRNICCLSNTTTSSINSFSFASNCSISRSARNDCGNFVALFEL